MGEQLLLARGQYLVLRGTLNLIILLHQKSMDTYLELFSASFFLQQEIYDVSNLILRMFSSGLSFHTSILEHEEETKQRT